MAFDRGWLRAPSATGVIRDVPAISESEAEAHRDDGYAQIASIEQLFGLPGHFARMEALYALAGRSDSADVQSLVFQASAIADPSDRRDTLLVLFVRLAELDPPSALALSRTPDFAADPVYEREVWRRWGERDLEAALRRAGALQSAPRRNLAAQALLAGYGYWGNEQTARIAERLAAKPDNRTRSARLEELAGDDPAAAIAYVHRIESPLHRRQAAAQLGLLLGQSGINGADGYAALFTDPALGSAFQNAAAQAAAEIDPAGTLEILLASDKDAPASRLVAAFTAVAGQDVGQALAWFERVEDPRQRKLLGAALAEQLARENPLRALSWARAVDDDFQRRIYTQVLSTLSETDPDLAMADAKTLDGRRQRLSAMMTVARQVSERDPERAVALLDNLELPEEREMLVQGIAMNWLQNDPEAALDWILASDTPARSDLLEGAAHTLAQLDLDTAIRLVPRVDKQQAPLWRQQIAANLAAKRSLGEARNFIAQYEGSPEYPEMMSALIQGLAHADAEAALKMISAVPGAGERQTLYSTVFMQYAEQAPRDAAAALASIDDDALRRNVTAQVLSRWTRSDPGAAERWADGLPAGEDRDAAIMGASSGWREVTPSRLRLVESIGNAELRRNAIGNALFRVAREDLERAERLLRNLNLSANEKEELRQQMELVRENSRRSHHIGVW